MRRLIAAPGNGVDLQQLVWQVSFGDALVARGALCAMGARRSPGTQLAILRADPCQSASPGKKARLRGSPLAEVRWSGRRPGAYLSGMLSDLAAAASDLLLGTLLSLKPQCCDV